MRPQCGFGGADRRRSVMFKPYVNHAAQHLADVGGVAVRTWLSNNLHLNMPSLHRSVNISKSVENATRKEFARKAAKTQKETKDGFSAKSKSSRLCVFARNKKWRDISKPTPI